MNNQINSQINCQPFNNQSIAIQAQNNASSSASSIPYPSSHSAVSRVEQIGKENFPVHANTQMPYVNLSGGMAFAEANNKIQKQGKTRATAQKTQQVGQSGLPKKKPKKYNHKVPTKNEIEALFYLSLKDAAATFDISPSKLKKHCREYGIRRWPSQFAQNQLREKIEKELGQRSFDQHSNSLVSPAINQPSSSGSNADNQVYAGDYQTSEINVEDSSIGHVDSYAEEPHSFQPIEREDSQEHLHSYVPDFQIQPLTYSLLPSISQLNLSPINQSNAKPLTGDAILRMARQAFKKL